VQRLGPPNWPAYPPGQAYGRIYDRDPAAGLEAARLGARLIASDLIELGINVDCLPLADVPVSGADRVIGDRAYGDTPAKVAAIAAAVAEGLAAGGVLPVLKHVPGHGRANAGQPRKAAGGARRPCNARVHRLRRIPSPEKIAVGNDGPRGFHGHRPGATGDNFGPQ